jgi:excisionase family DNA binding protein
MARRFPVQGIKAHLVYTVWEAAETLGCHRQTLIRWIRDHGLPADTGQKPWLVEGRDLKAFLGARQARARCRLALHHCYCLGCKAPREPDGRIADYIQQTPETGRLVALCPACGALMHKVIRRADLEVLRARLEVTVQQASPRLVSRDDPPLHVTFTKERQTHGKAQQG